jgi:hypothetical protein
MKLENQLYQEIPKFWKKSNFQNYKKKDIEFYNKFPYNILISCDYEIDEKNDSNIFSSFKNEHQDDLIKILFDERFYSIINN